MHKTDQELAELRNTLLRYRLEQIKDLFGLSYREVGRLFDVSSETARQWIQGTRPIRVKYWKRIDEVSQSLHLLHMLLFEFFVEEHIADIIRRPSQLFDGDAALDWILAKRFEEVGYKYKQLHDVLSYQA